MTYYTKHSIRITHQQKNKVETIKEVGNLKNIDIYRKAIEIMEELPDNFGNAVKDATLHIEVHAPSLAQKFQQEQLRTGYETGTIIRTAIDALYEDYEDGLL